MLIITVILFIILLIYFFIISIIFSNIILNIEECDISYNDEYEKNFYVKNFSLSIQIYIFKIIKFLKIYVYKDSIQILKFKIPFDFEGKIRKNDKLIYDLFEYIKLIRHNKDIISIKSLKPIITDLNLDLSFGAENPIVTTFTIPTISIIISIILSNSIKKYKDENYKYKITPKYINKNIFKINLNTKLSFNTLRLLIFVKQYKKLKVID